MINVEAEKQKLFQKNPEILLDLLIKLSMKNYTKSSPTVIS